MVRKRIGLSKDVARREEETPIVTVRDEELFAVAGGATLLSNSFSSAVKTVGEALGTMARKG